MEQIKGDMNYSLGKEKLKEKAAGEMLFKRKDNKRIQPASYHSVHERQLTRDLNGNSINGLVRKTVTSGSL